MNESLLTVNDVAKMLNRSGESVRGYERQGKLPAIKTLRGLRLFKEKDVREFAGKLCAKRVRER